MQRLMDTGLRRELGAAAALLAQHPTLAVLAIGRHADLMAAIRASQRADRRRQFEDGELVREEAVRQLLAMRRTPELVAARNREELRRSISEETLKVEACQAAAS